MTLVVTVTLGKPVVTSATTASGQTGVPFSYQITATNSPTSFAATPLPSGVTVNTATGLISGTPTATGATNVSLSATNATGTSTSVTLVITVTLGKPVITSATTASGQTGVAFSYQITATNNPTSYTATPLPAGLTVNTATGLISGTPSAVATTNVSLTATNATGTSTTVVLVITVTLGKPAVTSATAANGQTGSAFSYQITATNSPTSYSATPLPAGLTLNAASGLISGTPSAVATTNVSLTASNATGSSPTVNLAITVVPSSPVINSPTTASGQTGSAFSYQIAASNNPTSFSATGLPPGLTVNASTGLISGTPTSPGVYVVTLGANDGTNGSATLTLTILATLPYTTDFETGEGYTLGTLNGQLGWTVGTGAAVVANADFAHGAQSVQLSPSTPPAVIGQTFASSAGETIEFFDFYAKPVAGTPPGTSSTFTIEQSEFSFQLSGSQGVLQSFNGNGSGGGTWTSTPFTIPLGAGHQAASWVRLTARLDFSRQLWDLYANSQMVAADVPFIGPSTSTYLSTFQLQGDVTSASGFDDIFAGPTNPLFADVNNDGIDDAWETAHGLSLAVNDRYLSPTGNGITVLQAYLAGTNPNDFYNGVLPVITSLVNGGYVGSQGLVSVKVTKASDGTALSNAPVTLAVTNGVSQISATPGGTAATQISVQTNAQGIAQGYVTFTNSTSDVLVASAQSGSQTATISINIAAIPIPTSNLVAWYNAASGASPTSWTDFSGNGNTLTAFDGAAPITFLPTALNGQPVIQFNAGQAYIDEIVSFLPVNSDMTIFVVNATIDGNNNYLLGSTGYLAGGDSGFLLTTNNGVETFFWRAADTSLQQLSVPILAQGTFAITSLVSSAQGKTLYQNGTAVAATADGTNLIWPHYPYQGSVAGIADLELGIAPGYPAYATGQVADVIIYRSALSDTDRLTVEKYLNQRYSLVTAPPPAPTNLVANPIAGTQVSLYWQGTVGSNYTIMRQNGSGGFIAIGTVNNRQRSYFDTTAIAGTTYSYQVVATSLAGNSAPSNTVTVTTPSGGTTAMPLTGVRLWLSPDTLPAAGSPIGTWLDQSASHNDASQSIPSNQPTIVPGAMNGQPVVRFDGTSSYLNLPFLMNGANAGDLFVVLRGSTTANRCLVSGFGSNSLTYYPASSPGQLSDSFGSTGSAHLFGAGSADLTQAHLYNVSTAANYWAASLDGNLLASTLTNTVDFSNGTGALIGAYRDPGFFYNPDSNFRGDIAEVIAYDHVLSQAERTAVGRYLNQRYAFVAAVPSVPTNLSAVAISTTQVSLSWQAAAGTGAVIERQSGTGSFVTVGTTSAGSSYIDSTVVAGTSYTYRVSATNLSGTSAPSSTAAVTTPAGGGTSMPLTGMRLWLKADTIPNAGGLSNWADQSGSHNDATQITATNQPVVVPGAMNGQPVVRFDGATSYLNLNFLMNGASAGDIFVIVRGSTTTNRCLISSFGLSSVTFFPAAGPGRIQDNFGSTSSGYLFGAGSADLTQPHLYNVSAGTNSWTASLDGAVLYSNNTNTVNFAGALTPPVIGAYRDPSVFYNPDDNFQGDIAEIIAYDRILSAGERQAVGLYLNQRYAVLALPSAPANVSAVAVSSTQVSVTWSSVPAGTGAILQRQDAGGGFVSIANITSGSSFIDSTAVAGATYTYQVIATNLAGSSTPSAPVIVTTPAIATPPMPVTGMRLWLKADSIPAGSGAVTYWADQSGRGNDATQFNFPNQPVLVQSAINGQPVVRFDGASSYLNLPFFMSGAGAGDMFVVVRTATATTTNAVLVSGFGAGAVTYYPAGSSNQIADNFGSYNAPATVIASFSDLTQPHLYNVVSATDFWATGLDGNWIVSSDFNPIDFANNQTAPVIGAYINPGDIFDATNFFQGDIAEILVFDRMLADDERGAVGKYLGQKYGLTFATPVAPTNLTATVVGSTQVELNWNASSPAPQYYTVERQTGTGPWTQIGTATSPATFFFDSSPPSQTSVQYRVRAATPGGYSGYTNVATAQSPLGVDASDGLPAYVDVALGLDPTGSNTRAAPPAPVPINPPPPPPPNPNATTAPVVILVTPSSATLF